MTTKPDPCTDLGYPASFPWWWKRVEYTNGTWTITVPSHELHEHLFRDIRRLREKAYDVEINKKARTATITITRNTE